MVLHFATLPGEGDGTMADVPARSWLTLLEDASVTCHGAFAAASTTSF